MAHMRVKIAGVEFNNPVIAASGCVGFGREYEELFPLSRLGGISVKGMTLHPKAGNPPPRIAETPKRYAQFCRPGKSGRRLFY